MLHRSFGQYDASRKMRDRLQNFQQDLSLGEIEKLLIPQQTQQIGGSRPIMTNLGFSCQNLSNTQGCILCLKSVVHNNPGVYYCTIS